MLHLGCCCSTCDIGSDTFGRSDNVSLGASWDVRTTSPEILSNKAASGTSGDLVVFTTGHPDVIAAAVVEVDITLADDTDEAEIIVNHDGSDDDIYHFVRIRNYEIELYERTGGSNSLLVCASIDLPSNPKVTVYFDADSSGMFGATCGDAEIKATANPQGQFVGLGTGTVTNLVQFDNFVFKRHKQDGNNCPQLVNCLIQRDDFQRPNSSSLGCAWTEASGTWAIASNKIESTAAGIVILNEPHPHGDTTMIVEVTAEHSSSSGKIDLIVGLVDSSNYYYGRFATAGGSGSIDIRKCVAGVHSSILALPNVTINNATPHAFRVITNEAGNITAHLGATGLTCLPQTITGTQCGLGAAGSGTAIFESFAFSRAYHSSAAPGCEQMPFLAVCTHCTGGTTAYTYKVVISGVVNGTGAGCTNCAAMNGIYFLDALEVTGSSQCRWCAPLSSSITCTSFTLISLELVMYVPTITQSVRIVPTVGCPASGAAVFIEDTGSGLPHDCDYSAHSVSGAVVPPTCDGSGGSCTITAYA